MLTKETPCKHPCYFSGIAIRSYTVPIVEKVVERAKVDSEPTQGYRSYLTAKTAVRRTKIGGAGARILTWPKIRCSQTDSYTYVVIFAKIDFFEVVFIFSSPLGELLRETFLS